MVVEIEQGFYSMLGESYALIRSDFSARRPKTYWALDRLSRLVLSAKIRNRLHARFMEESRTAEAFRANNRYLMMALRAP